MPKSYRQSGKQTVSKPSPAQPSPVNTSSYRNRNIGNVSDHGTNTIKLQQSEQLQKNTPNMPSPLVESPLSEITWPMSEISVAEKLQSQTKEFQYQSEGIKKLLKVKEPKGRTNPELPEGASMSKGQQIFPPGLLGKAEIHEQMRLDVIVRMLVIADIMKKLKVLPLNGGDKNTLSTIVTVTGAKKQIGRGSNKDDTQAAHVAVGQLRINNQCIEKFLQKKEHELLRMWMTISLGFTHILRRIYNKVDSSCDAVYKEGLKQAVIHVLVSKQTDKLIDWVSISEAYILYKEMIIKKYISQLEKYKEKQENEEYRILAKELTVIQVHIPEMLTLGHQLQVESEIADLFSSETAPAYTAEEIDEYLD